MVGVFVIIEIYIIFSFSKILSHMLGIKKMHNSIALLDMK